MEKQPFLTTAPPPLKRQSRVKLHVLLALGFVASIAYFWQPNVLRTPWSTNASPHRSCHEKKGFSWNTTRALPHLAYEPCFEDFQCARLELPLDYFNGTTNDTIGLAVIRRPAAVPVTDSRYGGAVLLNPGGPGGSGIGMALGSGGKIQKFIDTDSDEGKFFDIISFDPRGVGASSPQMRCVQDDCEVQSWFLRLREEGSLGSSDASVGRLWSMMSAYGQSCSFLPEGKADVRQYITTASVASDMVSLIEAHGAWRELEAARLLGKGCACVKARKDGKPCDEVPEAVRYVKGEEGSLGSSDASIGRLWSMMSAYGQSCSSLPEGKADVRQYITTASVASDMVSLIEAHGAWRELEAARLLGKGCACAKARKDGKPCDEVPEAVRYVKGEEKILYWGFSYGTYLGLTYAAMFPDKIHRLVVDGVVDAWDYRQTLWFDNLVDTERDMGLFYYHCARAGYPACALANETGKTTEEGVKARFANILESLYHNPLPVVQNGHPEVISYSDVRSLIFASLYSPVQAFPFVANMLASIEKGDGIWFANFLLDYYKYTCPGCSGSASTSGALRNKTSDTTQLSPDAGMGIACTDGEDQSFLDRPLFEEHIKNVTKLSPTIGPEWAMIRLACARYNVRPVHRFTAPWEGKTSHPVLLLGNTADPVTPLRAAKKMSRGFEGSVVLTQDSPGHCTLAAASKCTTGHVREYFQTGELPPVNTTCKVDTLPFGNGPDGDANIMDEEMRQLSEDMATVQAALYQAGGSFIRPNKGLGGRNLAWWN